tara:strand:+ start:26655 stop:27770 length:1116 start_codon:yes stop_codon:yes gene_type:complete
MTSFKISKKTVHTDSRTSIIDKHVETIKKIEYDKKNIDKYRSELFLLEKTKKNFELRNNFSDAFSASKKIDDLKDKIHRIENDTELSDYLFNSITFIKEMNNDECMSVSNVGDDGIFKYISLDSKNNKGEMYKMYMEQCFPSEVSKRVEYNLNNAFICKDCSFKTTVDVSSGLIICFNCGLTEKYNISYLPEWNHAETHEYIKPYSYKRTNHFKEWINQIQGREGTIIPDEVINLLIVEIKKERLKDKSLITYSKIKEFLKKLKFNKYYEHIPNIIHKITGNKQLIINSELQVKLINMFNDIQEPFDNNCPKNRKNFLSYSYTLYKFFQLLNKDEYLVYFPLLKSREKLFEQENIWKKMCKDLNWIFVPCI